MPVTKDQAQMLTSLALDCRPIGAPRWHEPGVMAAVGKIAHWSLAEAIIEVISAAADRSAETPGVIGKFGSHRKAIEAKSAATERVAYDPREVCHVCNGTVGNHTRHTDHEFISVEANRARASRKAPDEVRAAIEPTRTFQPATEETA